MAKPLAFTIQLTPTKYLLDVIIWSTQDQLVKHLHKTYKESEEYYRGITNNPFCGIIQHEGEPRIVICTTNSIPVIAHEVVHATWKLDHLAGFNIDYNSQEFQAYMVSYIMEEILKQI